MGQHNEMSLALGSLNDLEEAVAETEESVRRFGHAFAGPDIRGCWQFYDNVRRNLRRFEGVLPNEEDVQARMGEIRGRISALG